MTPDQKREMASLFRKLRDSALRREIERLPAQAERYVKRALEYAPETNWGVWRDYNDGLRCCEPTLKFVIDAVGSVLQRRGVGLDWEVSPWYEYLADPSKRGKHWPISKPWRAEIERWVRLPNADGEAWLFYLFDAYGLDRELTPLDMLSIDREFWAAWYSARYKYLVDDFRCLPSSHREGGEQGYDIEAFLEAYGLGG